MPKTTGCDYKVKIEFIIHAEEDNHNLSQDEKLNLSDRLDDFYENIIDLVNKTDIGNRATLDLMPTHHEYKVTVKRGKQNEFRKN